MPALGSSLRIRTRRSVQFRWLPQTTHGAASRFGQLLNPEDSAWTRFGCRDDCRDRSRWRPDSRSVRRSARGVRPSDIPPIKCRRARETFLRGHPLKRSRRELLLLPPRRQGCRGTGRATTSALQGCSGARDGVEHDCDTQTLTAVTSRSVRFASREAQPDRDPPSLGRSRGSAERRSTAQPTLTLPGSPGPASSRLPLFPPFPIGGFEGDRPGDRGLRRDTAGLDGPRPVRAVAVVAPTHVCRTDAHRRLR